MTAHDGLIELKPNISLGFVISTSSYTFQVIAGTFQALFNQKNICFNDKEFNNLGIMNGSRYSGFGISNDLKVHKWDSQKV